MSLYLTCNIKIGRYLFDSVHEVTIAKSRKQVTNTAVIKLPNRYSADFLCNKINGGDEVIISLGYNDNPREEYRGYVAEIELGAPVTIRCEDEMYKLKRQKPKAESWPSVKLTQVLKHLVPSCKLEGVPDITLAPFYVYADKSVAAAIQELRDNFGLEVNFRGNTLFVGVPLTETDAANAEPVIYDLERNVIDPKLNFRRAEDVLIKVNAKSITADNKVLTAEVGDTEGSQTTMHFYNITALAELERQAEEKLKVLKYDGFRGSLTTFGLPYVEPGNIARITDRRYDGARTGSYFVDSVETTFGVNGGFRREVTIGRSAA